MPAADLASSIERFFNAAAEFFRHLAEIHWGTFFLALVCLLAMQLCRAWAWRNVLRAAYPDKRIAFLPLAAAYLAGAGINAVVPAHAGDVTKVFLAKRQIPDSSYPTVTSSFLGQTVFESLGHRPQPGQRCAQIMADPGHELTTRPLQSALPLTRVVQGRGGLKHLLLQRLDVTAQPRLRPYRKAPQPELSHRVPDGSVLSLDPSRRRDRAG